MKLCNLSIAGSLFMIAALLTGAAPTCRADNYQIDPVHSTVLFRVKHMGVGYFHGRFDALAGTFMFDEKNPVGLTFDLVVKADSVDTNNTDRDKHLKGPDFFNAKEFGTISFKSTKVTRNGEKGFNVSGDLEMHGVARPVTVTLEWVGTAPDQRAGGLRTGFEGTFTVKCSEFGMNFGAKGGLGDDVRVTVAFEGVAKK